MKYFALFAGVWLAVGAQAQISLGKSVSVSDYYNAGSEVFPGSTLVDGRFDDTGSPSDWSFWLTSNGQNTAWAVIDLGQQYSISSIDLQDTHNRGYYDRGAQDFVVSVSSDGTNYAPLITDAFSNSEWASLAHKNYNLSATGRYVKVDILSGWGGYSVGLNEVSVYGQATPEPATLAFLGCGLVALLRRRR